MKAFEDFVKELVREIDNRNAILNKKKNDLEVELANINKEIDSLIPAKSRAESYTVQDETCPRCRIHEGLTVKMKPIASENESDIFRCSHCSSEIEVEN